MTSPDQSIACDATVAADSEPYLANAVWTSLAGTHAEFAQRSGSGRRYRPEFSPFGAAEHYTQDSIADIARMLQHGERLTLITPAEPEVPAGYQIVRDAMVIQMVGTRDYASPDDPRIVRLGKDDVPDMLELVALTDPGPFRERTNELGTFVGIRNGEELVAMAGERMNAGKYVELSAICTHPNWRGRGLGTLLMTHLSAEVLARGQKPFLHVFSGNTVAIRLYEALGFRRARSLHLTALALSAPAV